MRRFIILPVNACLLLLMAGIWRGEPAASAADNLGFKAPPGFEVTLFADDDLAHDIHSMTIDAHGRVVVAGERYIKILHDTDGDGRADKATLFADRPRSGAHGLYFDGDDLLAVGDNAVWRFRDANGDGVADGEPALVLDGVLSRGHAANGLVRGPDGWYYLICGNDADVNPRHITLPGSPVKSNVVCGAVVRFSPDGKSSEVLAHGFRNPYDLDFHPLGNILTVDADGERDHHLPWYAGNRLFDIAQGMEHGWILKGWVHAWNRPESNLDNVERLVEIGRGSPTGVLVYRHRRFPERYRHGVFSICWSFGRIYFFPLERRGSTFKSELEIFMETTGETGFAPVDMAVDPAGDLYVAIGGRNTRGGVFRVHYNGSLASNAAGGDAVRQVLTADQPLASWSRAQWVPKAIALGKEAFESAATNTALPLAERIRSLEILVEVFNGLLALPAGHGDSTAEPEWIARAVWALSRSPDNDASRRFIAAMTCRNDPWIARATWEALASRSSQLDASLPLDWMSGLQSDDRRVRQAAIQAAKGAGFAAFQSSMRSLSDNASPRLTLGYWQIRGLNPAADYFTGCLRAFHQSNDAQTRLDAVRLLQLGLGDVKLVQNKVDVFDGYAANAIDRVPDAARGKVVSELAPLFPTGEAEVDRELARLLAMLSAESPGLLERWAGVWSDGNSRQEGDVHYLVAACKLPGPRPPEFTGRCAAALARLQHKMIADRKEPSRFWPVRVGEAFERLLALDPTLAPALIGDPAFGLADHFLFAKLMPEPHRTVAARKLLAAAAERERTKEPAWTPELIELAAALPAADVLPHLRRQWPKVALRDPLALALARHAEAEDRGRLVEALGSMQGGVVAAAASALQQLKAKAGETDLLAAITALRRFCLAPAERKAREALRALLGDWTGQKFAVKESGDLLAAHAAWFDWFSQAHPQSAQKLAGTGEVDLTAWKRRLDKVDWTVGDARRGRTLFEQRACHRCHEGGYRLGPDLRGVGGRWSREDLFYNIVDPNRDVSPTYSHTVIINRGGESYAGVLVYESPSVKLLQVAPDTTLRFAENDVREVRTGRTSLMPTGLLDGLADGDLADLYTYLKTEGTK